MRGSSLSAERSEAVKVAPAVSRCVAGTHEGAIKKMSKGISRLSLSIKRIPGRPITFAISCGSATRVVVP